MVFLDTHIWVWWVHEPGNLTQRQIDKIKENESNIVGISAISCWEIAIESTRLPGEFHRDPADQIIAATARFHGCPLVTSDSKILDYPYVDTIK
ncbi:MAG: type II toxin-antitoxin system VapC family toxin [Candidatus Aminicenantes bacterium]|jgi:PIN domain nuclease of toxin-antitoxin system